ncbi:unnamed protein product [Ranitomeya imitator]|uniref:Uncharacterized protein n=1 Tax=Ranitomeya imitator TaxID=111125 RepID=A0ABN9L996_9NEOB|nr:unnamed protein product [Ranitomeya imitator]
MMNDDDYWLACLLDPRYKGKLQNIMPHENLELILATKQSTLVDRLVQAFPAHSDVGYHDFALLAGSSGMQSGTSAPSSSSHQNRLFYTDPASLLRTGSSPQNRLLYTEPAAAEPAMDSRSMKDYIKKFSLDNGALGNQGYSRVLLQLFGYTGHGKSSFINSCKYVVDDGPYTAYAKVARSAEKPETMIRNAYELTETITLVDNRGCAKMNKNETGEIYAQLGNFMPLGCEVRWRPDYEDMVNIVLTADLVDRSADFIIVPVFVYSANTQISSAEESELKEILTKAKKITGLFPTVVITRKLSDNLPDIQEKFRRMGVENIFPVDNYTVEDHGKTRGNMRGS